MCQSCGSYVDPNSKFCSRCGARIEQEYSNPDDSIAESIENTTEDDERDVEDIINGRKEETGETDKKKEKKSIIIGLAMIIGIIIAIILMLNNGVLMFIGIIAYLISVLIKAIKSKKKNFTQICAMIFIPISAILIIIAIFNPNFFRGAGYEVRNSYLDQYSDSITIEAAFNNYFDNAKWSEKEINGVDYVIFSGTVEEEGEIVTADIWFRISGEVFYIDSMELDGFELNDIGIDWVMQAVYEY